MGWQALDETGGKCRCGNVNFNNYVIESLPCSLPHIHSHIHWVLHLAGSIHFKLLRSAHIPDSRLLLFALPLGIHFSASLCVHLCPSTRHTLPCLHTENIFTLQSGIYIFPRTLSIHLLVLQPGIHIFAHEQVMPYCCSPGTTPWQRFLYIDSYANHHLLLGTSTLHLGVRVNTHGWCQGKVIRT